MGEMSDGTDDPDDAAALAGYAEALADRMVDALPAWVVRTMVQRLATAQGSVTDAQRATVEATGRAVADEVADPLRGLLALDIDAQTTTPLEVVRGHLRRPTEVLRELGVPPVARDDFDAAQFPDDVYDLGPRAYADVDPGLQEPALAWGAAKAFVHLQRRRRTSGPERT
jgi:hypothetical protein